MALVGAIKIGEDTVEKPQLFSTFFIVVAIRPKSIHCPRYLSEYSSRPPLTRQEELRVVHRKIRRSSHLCQDSLYSEQPKRHFHGLEQINSGRQRGVSLPLPTFKGSECT
jgi:hypothetical protein